MPIISFFFTIFEPMVKSINWKKSIFLVYSLLVICPFIQSQSLPIIQNQANWQQHVSYSIDVKLDDVRQMLTGYEEFIYTNNSPNALNEIYIHLWPNAYKNNKTALVKQELENKNTNLYYATDKDRGWIDSLQPSINGKPVTLIFEKEIDYAKIILSQPLLPGQQLVFSTPFKVKIPGSVFSRMGVEDSIYCITQWFPKPAVYDVNGWNPMPYLDQGEFYSEFGKFTVNIEVPKEYVVAATGVLENKVEQEWLNNKISNSYLENPSTTAYKRLQFVQDSVHDFAWFASKKFKISKSGVRLPSGKFVETWIYAPKASKESLKQGLSYANEGVEFYSKKVGEYPYSIASVVITPLEAGGGMEYPTITNCQSIDKTTIIHEIGHNWFYGILGSNERNYPWMDESINTYYENRSDQQLIQTEISINQNKILNVNFSEFNSAALLYKLTARKNTDQSGNLHSTQYTNMNYGSIVYAKNPLSFAYLEAYMGTENFDKVMQRYFQEWKFKHPLPNDFFANLYRNGNDSLKWFQYSLLQGTSKQDIAICGNKKEIKICNLGNLNLPMPLSLKLGDSTLETHWFDKNTTFKWSEFNSWKNISDHSKDSLSACIELTKAPLDIYPYNNKLSYAQKNPLVQFKPFINLENNIAPAVFWMPIYGWNSYNKSMLGIAFYNSIVPEQKNELTFCPLYSLNTNNLNGYLDFKHRFYPNQSRFKNLAFGFRIKSYGHNDIIENNASAQYSKFEPYFEADLKPNYARSNISQKFIASWALINNSIGGYNYLHWNSKSMGLVHLNYTYERSVCFFPVKAQLDYQYNLNNGSINKLGMSIEQGFEFDKRKKTIRLRFFAGLFFQSNKQLNADELRNQRAYFMAGANTGINDYLFDESLLGRSETAVQNGNIFSKQIILNEAAFRANAVLGSSDKWMTALNLSIPIPKIKLPIGLYFDMNYAPLKQIENSTNVITYNKQLNYVGGIYFTIYKDIFAFYFPAEALCSNELRNYWNLNNQNAFFEKANFVLNLKEINPIKLIRNFSIN